MAFRSRRAVVSLTDSTAALMRKYATVTAKAAARKAIDHSGSKLQKRLLVSVMKHAMTSTPENTRYMARKATNALIGERLWPWTTLGRASAWRE